MIGKNIISSSIPAEFEEKMPSVKPIAKSSSSVANVAWEYAQYALKIINKIAQKEQKQNLYANSNRNTILTFFTK